MTDAVRSLPPVIIDTGPSPDAAVIWLHGLGADGHDFEPVVPALGLPAAPSIRFVFPHAPVRAVTINNGMSMRAWYDILSLDGGGEDEAGIRASERSVCGLIEALGAQGIASSRIVLAGFSQGGAIALHTGLRWRERLAGVMALSTYLPLARQAAAEALPGNLDTKLLMIHGRDDAIVSVARGRQSRDALIAMGVAVDWHEFPMGHELCMPEVAMISDWLQQALPPVR